MFHRWFASHKPFSAALLALAALAFSLVTVNGAPSTARASGSDDPIAQAIAQAKQSGQVVDIPSEFTETSRLGANPDGSLAATIGGSPAQTTRTGASHTT